MKVQNKRQKRSADFIRAPRSIRFPALASGGGRLALSIHSLASQARGSVRLEWMQALGSGIWGGKSNLRLHTALFSGYGDSMIDYNRKRTVFSVGLSLVDF